ncbi:MAG: hypothetical protein MZW92_67680 [Comamonadaceae bacterium]|nr:hypothetical protein [Comamonadaceae bacterium]
MLAEGIDTLVLGCTHYPLLKPLLQQVAGPGVALVDSAESMAERTAALLAAQQLATTSRAPPRYEFYRHRRAAALPDHRRALPRPHADQRAGGESGLTGSGARSGRRTSPLAPSPGLSPRAGERRSSLLFLPGDGAGVRECASYAGQ